MLLHTVVAALVVTLLLEIVELEHYILGWIWGCLTNIIYMVVLAVLVIKDAKKNPVAAANSTKIGMFIRFGVVAIATVLADIIFIEFHYIAYLGGIFIWKPFSFYEHIRSRILEERHAVLKG